MRRSWLRRNRLTIALPQLPTWGRGRAFCFPAAESPCISLVKLPSGGPGHKTRARPLLPGVTNLAFQVGICVLPTRTGILSHRRLRLASQTNPNLRTRCGINVRTSSGNNLTRYTTSAAEEFSSVRTRSSSAWLPSPVNSGRASRCDSDDHTRGDVIDDESDGSHGPFGVSRTG